MALDLTDARAAVAAYLLNDSCTILRPVLLDDDAGGTYPDPDGPTRIGPIACAFSKASGREIQVAELLRQRGSYRLSLPVDTDIRATDQVEVLGGTYNVVWAPPVAALSLSRVVGLEEAAL